MGQSLSDPVFVHSLRKVDSDLRYHVEFDGRESEAYEIEIFELPALVQADANLDFPDYTQIPDRLVEDTRRISAQSKEPISRTRLQRTSRLKKRN